ncbi:hypothetical protein [Pseudomonas syringae]|uniref:hypothetical protein n=1 Tax=Pseudomonas syringae TaxID=317 RepID=UPI003CF26BF0
MKKVAIFVEGYTEFYFVERLIEEVAGWGQVRIHLARQHGGILNIIKTAGAPEDVAVLTVMLVNCCGDGSVKSFILERKSRLIQQGYTYVLGLQDLYPKTLDNFEKFKTGISSGLSDPEIKIEICIAVAEVESWFLNEASHFIRINHLLTGGFIQSKVGFHPVQDCAETSVRHPARMLHEIYHLVGGQYKKREDEIKRLVDILDYSELYETVRAKSNSLDFFFKRVDSFFEMNPVTETT